MLYRKGFFFRQVESLPPTRIQIDVSHSPIKRYRAPWAAALKRAEVAEPYVVSHDSTILRLQFKSGPM
jgi:hypothetical protein